MTLSRADLTELVQFCRLRLSEESIPCFGPKAQYAREASLKFAKTHRANEGSKVCTEGSYCTSNSWNVAAMAGSHASVACVRTWYEDFRKDLARISSPTLVIHGDADRIVPYASSGQRTVKLVEGARLVTVKNGPHFITWTHADEVNTALLFFLREEKKLLLETPA